jgi:hypothetical protein
MKSILNQYEINMKLMCNGLIWKQYEIRMESILNQYEMNMKLM